MTNTELIETLRYCAEYGKCEGCSMWVAGGHCVGRLMKDAADALESAPHWIEPDGDHLPPLNEEVLVVWETSGHFGIAALTEYQDKAGVVHTLWEDDMSGFHDIDGVLWWMPIPKIPREAEE